MVESESAAAAPFFIKKPTIQKLVEGGSVVFECQIGGSPKPHIIWKKSGVPLTTGYRWVIPVLRFSLSLHGNLCGLRDLYFIWRVNAAVKQIP